MSKAKDLVIKESVSDLKQLLNHRSVTIASRIRMLIAIKSSEGEFLSKRKLGKLLGVSSSSIQIWRSQYEQGGLSLLLEDKRIGFKPSVLTKEEHKKIEEKLNNPTNGLRGYVELQDWISKEFGKTVKYNTLSKYCSKHFGAKSKVARKSHVKKDPQAVEDLKKTSDESVETFTKPTKTNTKK
jgi:Transposase and inactivated derivatives